MLKKMGTKLAALALAGVALAATAPAVLAQASSSATEAVTAVASTKSDMILVFGGVLTMAIAIWGIYKIVKIFGGK